LILVNRQFKKCTSTIDKIRPSVVESMVKVGKLESRMAKAKKKLSWTDKQRQVADLVQQGKSFTEITGLGYSLHMTSRVATAIKEGKKPPPRQEVEKTGKDGGNGAGGGNGGGGGSPQDLVAITGPKTAPIIFRIDRREIHLDPLELHRQYDYYADLAGKNDMSQTFSQIQTFGVQLIWILMQDIPLTENLLRAIFYGYK